MQFLILKLFSPLGLFNKQILKSRRSPTYFKDAKGSASPSLADKDAEMAKAWHAASSTDVHYYNNTIPVKTPTYYPFLKLS